MAREKKVKETIKDVHNEHMEEVVKKWKEYKTLKDQVEAELDSLSTEIKEFLAEIGETAIAVGEYQVKLSTSERTTFNKDIIKEKSPELYEEAVGSTTTVRLLVR